MIPDELIARLRTWLPAVGAAAAGEEPLLEPLGGGISNDVIAVSTSRGAFVYKTALPRLRVEAEWLSDVARVHREADCQRWLAGVLRPGEVPAVIAEDLDRHGYLMARAPDAAVNWKEAMLAGRPPAGAAALAGDLLGRIHAASAGDAALRERFGDKLVFDQLRLDPYLREVARRRPGLAGPLGRLVDQLAGAAECLVHGDFSPKNLLVLPGHLILLDHEVVHYGDPRFDLGFFFCHLFLKPLHLGLEALWPQPGEAWAAYRAAYPAVDEESWLPLLGACLAARVDGKSPAEYLRDQTKPRVRSLAEPLLRGEVNRLDEAVALARTL